VLYRLVSRVVAVAAERVSLLLVKEVFGSHVDVWPLVEAVVVYERMKDREKKRLEVVGFEMTEEKPKKRK